jgi:transposase InsO family protein
MSNPTVVRFGLLDNQGTLTGSAETSAIDPYCYWAARHGMIPSMSRPANPYDNASCESFLKTLKRGEIYANQHRDLGRQHRGIYRTLLQSTAIAFCAGLPFFGRI